MKTSDFWANVESYIFFTVAENGQWCKDWDVLMWNEEPVTDLNLAITLCRDNFNGLVVGLAEFNQMKVNNAQWDNF